jgi:putative transposase
MQVSVVLHLEVFGFWGGGVYQWQGCHCDSAQFIDRAKNFVGQNFWAREYYVSTVGRDEAQIREEIIEKQKRDKRLDRLNMFKRECQRKLASQPKADHKSSLRLWRRHMTAPYG